ncbi:hypothetical protein Deba_3140 [Desulfarculus baarsii DSM 2075]|uniref:Uncharacterized protein n=2 Tax=Desulfarculus baarsii TaxID=453230 RepID=E1QLQ8_DESB2|nr:hypothetical protein Deba_3140 [Desulfarculus baarsii DSM 2075]
MAGLYIKVIGYEWLSGGDNTCRPCQENNGQRYYVRPRPGQKALSEMPDAPLHPNCRCKARPIARVTVESSAGEQGGDDDYIQGGVRVMGGWWFNNGRTLWDGPVWKKWCGGDWGGGRDLRDPNAIGPADASPADAMDAVCKRHDDCYDSAVAREECDRRLVRELEALPADPARWPHPPVADEVEAADEYRTMALWWFKRKIEREALVGD